MHSSFFNSKPTVNGDISKKPEAQDEKATTGSVSFGTYSEYFKTGRSPIRRNVWNVQKIII
jgi:hypothetical protein